MTTLDVSYVSSLSWYFLVTFGLQVYFAGVIRTVLLRRRQIRFIFQGFYRLLLGEDAGATDEQRMMQMQVCTFTNVFCIVAICNLVIRWGRWVVGVNLMHLQPSSKRGMRLHTFYTFRICCGVDVCMHCLGDREMLQLTRHSNGGTKAEQTLLGRNHPQRSLMPLRSVVDVANVFKAVLLYTMSVCHLVLT